MKKKILLGFLVIVGLFAIIGCGNNDNSTSTKSDKKTKVSSKFNAKANVDDLYFKYISTNELGDTANGKIMKAGEYNIIVTHQKDTSKDDIAYEKMLITDKDQTINKVKWSLYNYSNDTVTSKIYMYAKDGGVYTITFAKYTKDFDMTDIINEFMNEVEFK